MGCTCERKDILLKGELSVVCFGINCTELQFSHAYKIAYVELEAKSHELLQSRKLCRKKKKKKVWKKSTFAKASNIFT